MKINRKIVYVSPVCHLDEVATQMSVICTSGGDTPAAPIISPEQGHGTPSGPCAPKIV